MNMGSWDLGIPTLDKDRATGMTPDAPENGALVAWLRTALRDDCTIVVQRTAHGTLSCAVLDPDALSMAPEIHGRLLLTLLFTDIAGSTQVAQRLGDEAWHELLEQHRAIVRAQLAQAGGKEIDASGDGFFAAFDAPARAVRCAVAIRRALRSIGLVVRAGIHAGECEAVGGRVSGIAVHVAARVAAIARPAEILVSGTVKDLVAGSGLALSSGAWHVLKGLPGRRRLHAVMGS